VLAILLIVLLWRQVRGPDILSQVMTGWQ
jgi:hypothetical protein